MRRARKRAVKALASQRYKKHWRRMFYDMGQPFKSLNNMVIDSVPGKANSLRTVRFGLSPHEIVIRMGLSRERNVMSKLAKIPYNFPIPRLLPFPLEVIENVPITLLDFIHHSNEMNNPPRLDHELALLSYLIEKNSTIDKLSNKISLTERGFELLSKKDYLVRNSLDSLIRFSVPATAFIGLFEFKDLSKELRYIRRTSRNTDYQGRPMNFENFNFGSNGNYVFSQMMKGLDYLLKREAKIDGKDPIDPFSPKYKLYERLCSAGGIMRAIASLQNPIQSKKNSNVIYDPRMLVPDMHPNNAGRSISHEAECFLPGRNKPSRGYELGDFVIKERERMIIVDVGRISFWNIENAYVRFACSPLTNLDAQAIIETYAYNIYEQLKEGIIETTAIRKMDSEFYPSSKIKTLIQVPSVDEFENLMPHEEFLARSALAAIGETAFEGPSRGCIDELDYNADYESLKHHKRSFGNLIYEYGIDKSKGDFKKCSDPVIISLYDIVKDTKFEQQYDSDNDTLILKDTEAAQAEKIPFLNVVNKRDGTNKCMVGIDQKDHYPNEIRIPRYMDKTIDLITRMLDVEYEFIAKYCPDLHSLVVTRELSEHIKKGEGIKYITEKLK